MPRSHAAMDADPPMRAAHRPARGVRGRAARVVVRALAILLAIGGGAAAQTPATIGQWSAGPVWPVAPINMMVLPTGKVMFYPGSGVSGDQPYTWDPETGAITALPKAGYDLFCSGHSFLPDGRVLISGGHIENFVGLPNASIYDPIANRWARVPDMNAGRWYPSSTTMPNGEVLVTSGFIDNVQLENALPQVFQPSTGTWRDLTNAVMRIPSYSFVFAHPSGKAVVVGPDRDTRLLDTAGAGQWTYLTSYNYLGFRDYGSAVMYDAPNRVLVAGGDQPPTDTAEVIDFGNANPTWQSTGRMTTPRRHLNLTLLPDDTVLAVGGTSGPGFNDLTSPTLASERWDPATGTWTAMASQTIGRFYHSAAMLLPDGRVLSAGGDNNYQAEIFSPPYLFKGARPVIASAPGHAQYGATFFIDTPSAASIAKVRLMRLPAVTHAFDQNQRNVHLAFTANATGLNVVAPPNATTAPPGHYMLFIVDGNGVPSIAQIMRIDAAAGADTTLPTVSLTAPAAGTTVSGIAVPLGASASDNVAVAGVRFRVDGIAVGIEDTSAPYGMSWNSRTVANGSHTLTALARDTANNVASSAPVTVTVSNAPDTSPPAVSLSQPAGGSTVSGLAVNVAATASDDVGVVGVQFKVDGANLGTEIASPPYATVWNSTSAANGSHTLTAVARDAAGNMATSAPVTVIASNIPGCMQQAIGPATLVAESGFLYAAYPFSAPSTKPDNGSFPTQSTLRLFEGSLELGSAHSSHSVIASQGQGRFSHWSNLDGTGEALHFSASDNSDPRTNGRVYSFCAPVPDTTPPTVSIAVPTSGATVSGSNVTVSAAAADNVAVAGVQIKLDGVNLGTENTAYPYSVTWNTTMSSNGAHLLSAVARDAAGNATTSAAVSVTVANASDTTPPTVSITAPAAGATVSGVATAVTANAADNVGVVGVQFKLDGANLGAEATGPPFGTTWNTTAATNGAHALTAVARDAAGNTTTSAPVGVTVGNAVACTQTAVNLAVTSNESGFSYVVYPFAPTGTSPDNVNFLTQSTLRLFENGVELGPPHASHTSIATQGLGRFSHWSGTDGSFEALRFSTSDNSSPLTNGRTYSWCVPASDTTPPTVAISAPSAGTSVSGTSVTVSANAADNVGVVGVQFKLDGANLGAEDTTAPYATTWNTTTAAIGAHTLTAVARDAAGNATTSAAVSVTVANASDTTPPTVSITAPAAGATVSGVALAVTANAADNVGVVGVQFKLDGANLGAEATGPPFGTTWNTTAATNGAHALTAVARDGAGNTATSAAVTVTVSNAAACTQTAVNLAVTSNESGFSYVVYPFGPTGTSPDNVNFLTQSTLRLFENGVELGPAHAAHTAIATQGLGLFSHWSATDGTFEALRFSTSDNSSPLTNGRTYSWCVPASDTTAPTVAISAPAAGASVSGTSVTVSANAADNVGVVGVQFKLDGANLGAEDTTAPFATTWNTTTAANGAHTLTAVARDAAGNSTTSAAVGVTVANVVDTTPPSVAITAPAQGASVARNITVAATASDNVAVVGVQFKVDGVNLGAESTTAPYSVRWNTGSATPGAHTLTAVARDAAGNATTSAPVSVTVR